MKNNRTSRIILGTLQSVTALGAIPAGLSFVLDPGGHNNGTGPELLAHSPFHNFLIPGLFLLIINGFGNLTGALMAFLKSRRAGEAGIILGIIMVLWITLQVTWIGLSSFLQPLFFLIGVIEIILGILVLKLQRHAGVH